MTRSNRPWPDPWLDSVTPGPPRRVPSKALVAGTSALVATASLLAWALATF